VHHIFSHFIADRERKGLGSVFWNTLSVHMKRPPWHIWAAEGLSLLNKHTAPSSKSTQTLKPHLRHGFKFDLINKNNIIIRLYS